MKLFRTLVKLLIIIGALNWGLIAFFHYDLVADLFGGPMMMGTRVSYGVIGIAGLLSLIFFCRRCCSTGGGCGCGPTCGCGNCRKP
jgi:uncharacterized membrane protein YuzA (DUF378 family)